MRLFRPKKTLPRRAALAGRPVRLPAESVTETGEGGAEVAVRLPRPRWQTWLGAEEMAVRRFELDELGREVYDGCDGRTEVSALVKRFARRHGMSLAEAEMAVTQFLRTLMERGLVGMEVDREIRERTE
jgi:hypothetical protein